MNITIFRMLIFIHYLPAVISELIHYTTVRNLDEVASQMPLIQVLVPRIMNLKPQLRDPSKVLHIWGLSFFQFKLCVLFRSVIVFVKDDAYIHEKYLTTL